LRFLESVFVLKQIRIVVLFKIPKTCAYMWVIVMGLQLLF